MNEEEATLDELAEILPGVARLLAGVWFRTAVWSVETSARVMRAVIPDEATHVFAEAGDGLRVRARELLGVEEIDDRVQELMPASSPNGGQSTAELRERGAELLRQSADVTEDEDIHPAYARILTELAPDEARILRLLALHGAQPTVDVRAANLIGVGSQLVAQGLNMIGTEAGLRHPERVPAYLNNLDRLGLIWFSHDALDDPQRYQVLEAQPDTMEAIERAGRARTVQRSVRLTAFGEDFVKVVLPVQSSK
jgi:hypothetical protein